jgi:hypothetical protein
MGPLDQLATDLGSQATDTATKAATAAALATAQAADQAAAAALSTDAATITTDANSLQAAINAWISSGGATQTKKAAVKPVQYMQSVCPLCPNYVPPVTAPATVDATRSVEKTATYAETAEHCTAHACRQAGCGERVRSFLAHRRKPIANLISRLRRR